MRYIVEINIEPATDVGREKIARIAALMLHNALDREGFDWLILAGCDDDEDTFAKMRRASPAYSLDATGRQLRGK